MLSRRTFLTASASALSAGSSPLAAFEPQRLPQGGRLIGAVPFTAAAAPDAPPLGRLLGSELDARLFTDLAALDHGSLVTPNETFFVRTAAPQRLPATRSWTIDIGGLVARPQQLAIGSIERAAVPVGSHVIECAGNLHPANYGLMSAARWEGVPVLPLLDRAQPRVDARYVLVSGVDEYTQPSTTSVPGCSWIFSRDDLERANAFLAVRMNGAALPPRHGAPVRLVVPGWYGCSSVKWVNHLELVREDALPTSQMSEYAQRTHQQGEPRLAADYAPATIDTAAMPVRVEKWMNDGQVGYRVVGIMWGGTKPTNALLIRFTPAERWVPVDDCPLPSSTTAWTVWTHRWRPSTPRRYQIALKVDDSSIPTRRLDLFSYTREVQIDVV